jgi:dTDP-4-dehydrorhamnose reductase
LHAIAFLANIAANYFARLLLFSGEIIHFASRRQLQALVDIAAGASLFCGRQEKVTMKESKDRVCRSVDLVDFQQASRIPVADGSRIRMVPISENNKPGLLILGARGFVGSVVSNLARDSHRVIRADRNRVSDETNAVVDITDPSQVNGVLHEIRPDRVVLLAAISDIDLCERKPEQAWAINLRGVENVANVCAQIGARLLFTSTGAVFDGRKIGYVESDSVSPVSVYSQTKAAAESAVLSLLPSGIVLRVSLVLGRTQQGETNSVVDSLARRWSRGEVVRAPVYEWRNPIDVSTLANWILELIANPDANGIVHTGTLEAVSRFEIATALAARLGFAPSLVVPETEPPAGRAHRGAHQHLLSTRLSRLCVTPTPSVETVFERSIHAVA